MLAYTALDGLRAINRDFDFGWQPVVHNELIAPRRDWRGGLRAGQEFGRHPRGIVLALLALGAVAWQR